MSVRVALDALEEEIAKLGAAAHLVTVGPDARPHVVSVSVSVDGDRLRMGAGSTTRANVSRSPTCTLLWGAPAGAAYSLIVDGTAAIAGEDQEVQITPLRAVLHRVVTAPADLPGCVPVDLEAPQPGS